MDNKLRVIKTQDIKSKSNRKQYGDNALIFDVSGGIYMGAGAGNEPTIISGGVALQNTSDTLDDINNNTVFVKFVQQSLTDSEKAQARANIGVEDSIMWEKFD